MPEGLAELAGRLESVGWDLLECFEDDGFQLRRYRRPNDGEGRDLIQRMPSDERLCRGARERSLPRQHLVDDARQTVDVGSPVDVAFG